MEVPLQHQVGQFNHYNTLITMAAGRPKNEGQPRKYVVADDVHEWIIGHGGGRYLTDTIRAIKSQYQKP